MTLAIESLRPEVDLDGAKHKLVATTNRRPLSGEGKDPSKNPFGFLLQMAKQKQPQLCATDSAHLPKAFLKAHKISKRKKHCDLFFAKNADDLRTQGLSRVKPGGHIVWSWPKKDEIRTSPLVFGKKSRPELDFFIDRHLLTLAFAFEHGGIKYHLLRKPVKVFENPTLKSFLADRQNPEYLKEPRTKETYAFVITIPYNFDRNMALEHMTAVYQLRKKDPTRDVNVFLILNTPSGAIEGRGWGDSSPEKWEKEFLPQVEGVRKRFETLGAKVFVRPRLPQKSTDDSMYYQFDYQKIVIWNLRYEQIAFLDADMMIGNDPGQVFAFCGQHPMCAVQDPGAHGGYFNNGFFIMNGKLEVIEELIHAWWAPSPPWRQIAMQDIMNEVYDGRWKPLPEDFNFQGMKHGHYWEPCSAKFVHYKDCDKHMDIPFCQDYDKQRKEASSAFPELFNYKFKH